MSTEQLSLNNQLIIACRTGIIERIEKLLDDGANINGPNESGQTPLITAVQNQRGRIVKYLLDRGADINIKHGVYKYSAIDVATTAESVEVLVKAGANIESRFNGMTPLHNAVSSGKNIIVETLLYAGANIEAVVNNNDPYYDGSTPLMIAVNDGDYDMCALLISRSANVNYETPRRKTCLNIACKNGLYKIARLLIENGVNVNHKDIEGRTALMYACMYADSKSYEDVIRLLIRKGADINIRDSAGYDVFDYISSGTGILRGEVKQFDRIGSSFRNEHMDEIIDLLINKINSDVQAMEETLEKKGMEKLAARTIAIEHFDPRSLSIQSEIREAHRNRKSKKGGKRKSKRSRTRRNKKR